MALFRKKADPISARSKELNAQISALEAEIKALSHKIEHPPSQPSIRPAAPPHSSAPAAPVIPKAGSLPRDPVFEKLDYQKARQAPETESPRAHFNDLGVRKYDLPGAFQRLRKLFHGSPAANPKLVSYLAAGSIKGLRPLRYEKRIARNRFLFLSVLFALILWGILYAIFKQR